MADASEATPASKQRGRKVPAGRRATRSTAKPAAEVAASEQPSQSLPQSQPQSQLESQLTPRQLAPAMQSQQTPAPQAPPTQRRGEPEGAEQPKQQPAPMRDAQPAGSSMTHNTARQSGRLGSRLTGTHAAIPACSTASQPGAAHEQVCLHMAVHIDMSHSFRSSCIENMIIEPIDHLRPPVAARRIAGPPRQLPW